MKSNNIRRRWLTVLLTLFLFCHVVVAQIVAWQMMPRDYDSVTRIGKDLFKIKKSGKYGLIKSDGSVILDLKADNMTALYSERALVIAHENGKDVVIGVLSSNGHYQGFEKKYYTIDGQAFYSDGLLTVADEMGRLGYIDDTGNAVLGFDGSFDYIKPFTEGYAAVFKNETYLLIDKRGVEAQMIIGVGEVYGGTNVCNGIAYIWDTDGGMYTYDVRTGKCRKAREPYNNQPDYLYCYQGVSGRGTEPNYTDMVYTGSKGPEPYVKDGLYGYSAAGFLLPAQFSSATPFVDGLAIVEKDGLTGILKYDAFGGRFDLDVPKGVIRYRKGSTASCNFVVGYPHAIRPDDVKVMVRDSSNANVAIINEGAGKYTFEVKPNDGMVDYVVCIEACGLNLWEGKASYTFKKHIVPLVTQINVAGYKADVNDRIEVTATVTNPNDEPLTADIHITGSNCLVPKSATVTVPAKGSKQLKTVFVVREKSTEQCATVSTTKGGSASTGNLTLECFY